MQTFNTYMTGNRGSKPSWLDWYPAEDRLLLGSTKDSTAVLMVDIAGGRGHYLIAFKESFPEAKGRMILQEVPEVINDIIDPDPSIEPMIHDMFEPQPVQGKRL